MSDQPQNMGMSETEALRLLRDECQTDDFERNGLNLDHIICQFLRSHGYDNLANAMNSVECRRA